MSAAWLQLHTVLSLKVDATEAYRLMHAYRDEELAKAKATDGQAYDGELAMLRGLVRTLRVAAREGDLTAVQQALINHATDDAKAREQAKGKSTAPSGDATPDLHDRILAAVRAFQVDRHRGGGYDQQLAAHITAALQGDK